MIYISYEHPSVYFTHIHVYGYVTFTNYIYLIYMCKPDLVLNNLQWLICHKTKTKPHNLKTLIFDWIGNVYQLKISLKMTSCTLNN